ncbi:SDR family NAD(P)-dependent oxidoreductase [Peristeroidobacter soli]|jgi:short-subunit dehydrogenase|uniref:SDR family NAD(P)-dependent oxidoreductase n=1 Tax=Peristeroidobacter soli TaxID=2497877 RepID=UPI00101C5B92|nr:SDR family NAD(P)-dependent oxidoreductase [Peristeroidobacter soli]
MPGAIVIGASSGIGAALARRLSSQGYRVGLAARRGDLLESIRSSLPDAAFTKVIDIAQPEHAMSALRELAAEVGDVELYVVSSGVGYINPTLEWSQERSTIEVNVLGFTAMVNAAIHALEQRGSGHLVGISSIAALRGGRAAPAYNASKAFVSNYLEGIRQRCHRNGLPITVTDIQPGFVATAMAQGPGLFWVAPAEKAAEQILAAIRGRKRHAYVTRRWRLMAWLLRGLPAAWYQRM